MISAIIARNFSGACRSPRPQAPTAASPAGSPLASVNVPARASGARRGRESPSDITPPLKTACGHSTCPPGPVSTKESATLRPLTDSDPGWQGSGWCPCLGSPEIPPSAPLHAGSLAGYNAAVWSCPASPRRQIKAGKGKKPMSNQRHTKVAKFQILKPTGDMKWAELGRLLRDAQYGVFGWQVLLLAKSICNSLVSDPPGTVLPERKIGALNRQLRQMLKDEGEPTMPHWTDSQRPGHFPTVWWARCRSTSCVPSPREANGAKSCGARQPCQRFAGTSRFRSAATSLNTTVWNVIHPGPWNWTSWCRSGPTLASSENWKA